MNLHMLDAEDRLPMLEDMNIDQLRHQLDQCSLAVALGDDPAGAEEVAAECMAEMSTRGF